MTYMSSMRNVGREAAGGDVTVFLAEPAVQRACFECAAPGLPLAPMVGNRRVEALIVETQKREVAFEADPAPTAGGSAERFCAGGPVLRRGWRCLFEEGVEPAVEPRVEGPTRLAQIDLCLTAGG